MVLVADHEYSDEDAKRVQAILTNYMADGYVICLIYEKSKVVIYAIGLRCVRWQFRAQSMSKEQTPSEPKPESKPKSKPEQRLIPNTDTGWMCLR